MADKTETNHTQQVETVPLAYHEVCMERFRRIVKYLIVGWAFSVIAIVTIFTYLWLQYDYTSTTEYSGVYNLTDSQGNVISSDITPADVVKILEAIEDGKIKTNSNQNP